MRAFPLLRAFSPNRTDQLGIFETFFRPFVLFGPIVRITRQLTKTILFLIFEIVNVYKKITDKILVFILFLLLYRTIPSGPIPFSQADLKQLISPYDVYKRQIRTDLFQLPRMPLGCFLSSCLQFAFVFRCLARKSPAINKTIPYSSAKLQGILCVFTQRSKRPLYFCQS